MSPRIIKPPKKGTAMLIDLHTHTIASGHGSTDTISDMAKEASRRGMRLLGISDHAPAILGAAKASYFRSLQHAPRKRFQVSLLFGAEANIISYDGRLDLDQTTLSCLDYCIASLHPPCLRPGTRRQNTESYIAAMKNPLVTIVGHPDDDRYPIEDETFVTAAARFRILLEVNESSLSPNGYRGDAAARYRALLPLCVLHRVPILVGSDSHGRKNVGTSVYAEALLQELHFPTDLIMNLHPELLFSYLHPAGVLASLP